MNPRKFRSNAIAVLILVIASSTLLAQTDDPGCNLCLTGTDNGCVAVYDCNFATGCTSYNFKSVCGGTFELCAWTACPNGGNCPHCQACVTIYDPAPPTVFIGRCSTSGVGNCQPPSPDCHNCCSVTLLPNKTYVMEVCLIACPGNPGCAGCEAQFGCQAHGCISNSACCP